MTNPNIDRDVVKELSKEQRDELNADPITGEPGAHPVGTGVGAAGGAATGAAIGAVGGPVGAIVGGVVGAVVGGLAGKGVAEKVNPTEEDAYWRAEHLNTPYYSETLTTYSDLDYDRDYQDAYRLGYSTRHDYPHETRFEDVENDLRLKWEQTKRESRLTWEEAKLAVKDAWNRVTH
ncbi:hypothetical protein DJ533_09495 [Acinetobacter defluvii]|uniref:Glycine zipper domain-containing protein n=1 Tax=Acinetobacter defluvii TaxID=1871111 RepID=A0A2S2FCT2_9GAMM|nr:hypothetical protein [Acinetobacter defluvii]AWL28786.1 hypothetical protein DJ533_09495 [Acinetobacter defluvii]